jgi:hypothetical protein
MWLAHESTGTPRAFDPWRDVNEDDVAAAGFAWRTDPFTGKDVYRVLTIASEVHRPFDPREEHHGRPHSVTCKPTNSDTAPAHTPALAAA